MTWNGSLILIMRFSNFHLPFYILKIYFPIVAALFLINKINSADRRVSIIERGTNWGSPKTCPALSHGGGELTTVNRRIAQMKEKINHTKDNLLSMNQVAPTFLV